MIVHFNNVKVTVSISKDFFAFLAKRGTLRAFLDQAKNLYQYKKNKLSEGKTYFTDMKPQNWIVSSVTWSETEQGHNFWSAEHIAWQRYLTEELQKQGVPSDICKCLNPIEWTVVE